jgi:hypothetical protein
MRSAYCELPIGPATRSQVLPEGTWMWEADRPERLTSTDGRTIVLPPDTALTAEFGLFIAGRGRRYRITARSPRVARPQATPDARWAPRAAAV